MRFEINWASLIVGSKCTVLALFYFVFEGNFPRTVPGGRFNRGFFALPVWASYIWRGFYMEGLIFGILRYFDAANTIAGKGIQLRSPTLIYIYFSW